MPFHAPSLRESILPSLRFLRGANRVTWASLPGVRDSVSSWWKFFFSQEFVSSLHPAS